MQARVAVAVWGLVALCVLLLGVACGGPEAGFEGERGSEDTLAWGRESVLVNPTTSQLFGLLAKGRQGWQVEELPPPVELTPERTAVRLGVLCVEYLAEVSAGRETQAVGRLSQIDASLRALGIGPSDTVSLPGIGGSVEPLLADALLLDARLERLMGLRQRADLYALWQAAVWVELGCIATKLALHGSNEPLGEVVVGQRFHLPKALDALAEWVYRSQSVGAAYERLADLRCIFDAVQISYAYEAVESDTLEAVTRIGNQMQLSLSRAQLEQLHRHLERARGALFDV